MHSSLPVRPIDRFISKALRRKRWVVLLRTLAAIAAALIIVTVIAVVLGQRIGYTDKIVNAARGFLLLVPLGLIVLLLLVPFAALRRDRGIRLIESRAAEFAGRIETYVEMRDGYSLRDAENSSEKARRAINRREPRELSEESKAVFGRDGFGTLLANDSYRVAQRVPVSQIVPHRQWLLPLLALLTLIAAAFGFYSFSEKRWVNGAQHVWVGWRTPGLVEPRTLAVTPGSLDLLYGDNLTIDVQAGGFTTDRLTLELREASGEWQSSVLEADKKRSIQFYHLPGVAGFAIPCFIRLHQKRRVQRHGYFCGQIEKCQHDLASTGMDAAPASDCFRAR